MSRLDQSSPAWPRHHDGKRLTMGEITRTDPALARRLQAHSLLRVLTDLAAPGAIVEVVESPQGVTGRTIISLPHHDA